MVHTKNMLLWPLICRKISLQSSQSATTPRKQTLLWILQTIKIIFSKVFFVTKGPFSFAESPTHQHLLVIKMMTKWIWVKRAISSWITIISISTSWLINITKVRKEKPLSQSSLCQKDSWIEIAKNSHIFLVVIILTFCVFFSD